MCEDVDALLFDADGDKDEDLYVVSRGYEYEAEDSNLSDRLYINHGNGKFRKAVDCLPDDRASGSTVVAVDYDGDGDQDLFVGGRIVPGRYPECPKSMLLINDGKVEFILIIEIYEKFMHRQ